MLQAVILTEEHPSLRPHLAHLGTSQIDFCSTSLSHFSMHLNTRQNQPTKWVTMTQNSFFILNFIDPVFFFAVQFQCQ